MRACLNGVYFPCLERNRACTRRLSLARKRDTNSFFLEKKKQPQLVQPVFSREFFLFLFFKYNVLTDRFTDSTKNYENPQCSYRGKMKKQQQRKCVRETGSSDTSLFYIHSREKRLPMGQVTKTQLLFLPYTTCVIASTTFIQPSTHVIVVQNEPYRAAISGGKNGKAVAV